MEEANLLDYWHILLRRKKLIIGITMGATVIAIIYSLLATKIYKAEATLLPIGGSENMGITALLAQSGVGDLLSSVNSLQTSTPLMAVLDSRTLGERIIEKFDLMKFFFEDLWDAEKQQWKGDNPGKPPHIEEGLKILRRKHIKFQQEPELSLIFIEGQFENPELATRVGNGYIE